MGEEFYCILKLVSGEEIFSLMSIDENDGDPIIILQNPVIMKSHHNNNGSYVKIKPWVELSSDDLFFIKLDKVITMTETNDDKIIKIYEHYLKSDSIETYKPGGKVPLSTEMGYVSSVEEARKKLENLYNNIKEL
jgi:hypothetical protein